MVTGEVVVSTTRPETIIGDVAVAVNSSDPRYAHMIGRTVRHPFRTDCHIPIVADNDHVDPEFGTGAVKITPAHDKNDFAIGNRHGLPLINILSESGAIQTDGLGCNERGQSFDGLPRYVL